MLVQNLATIPKHRTVANSVRVESICYEPAQVLDWALGGNVFPSIEADVFERPLKFFIAFRLGF